MPGILGQILVLVAFVASLVAVAGFFRAAQHPDRDAAWRRIGGWAWIAMTGALAVAGSILLYLLVTHQFQYAYVYQYSSRGLPLSYLLSTFWAGQEGSFFLWMMLNAYVGLALLRWVPRDYQMPVMTVVAGCQVFLVSMIVGLKLGPVGIGSSPFATLAERFPQAPMLQVPGFVPADGQGLNDLLQNPWMVIHPPTLFTGFALTIVPFAFAIAALWKKRYTDWVRPALPWTLVSLAVLGVGITMGGYWAYVTLSFGGYWAWDPVENSSLVPWLVGVAALHAMLVQKKTAGGHRAALLLSILAFMLVVYSTFLTRSGILGDISVHSFVDLGLSAQLVVWMGAMALAGFGMLALRWRELPRPDREPPYLSREFMIFSGAMLLCALAAVILLGTSSPIFGRLFRDNPAAVPITFYNKWSLPLAVGITFLIALGQLFWWHRMSVEQLNRIVVRPLGLAVASTAAILLLTPFAQRTAAPAPGAQTAAVQAGVLEGLGGFWAQHSTGILLLLLLLMGFFALYGNAFVLWRVGRGNARLAGGALSHVGFALVILGVLASSGFSNAIGRGGVAMATGTGQSRDNFVLTRGEKRQVGPDYAVAYAGREKTDEGYDRFLLDFTRPDGSTFRLAPVVYQTAKGQWIQHPDVRAFVEKDIYAAVTPSAMFEQPGDDTRGQLEMARGETAEIGNGAYRVTFKGYDTHVPEGMVPDSAVAVAAVLELTTVATGEVQTLRPVYMVLPGGVQQYLQARVPDLGIGVTFVKMNVDTERVTLGFDGVTVAPEDWIVVQAYEKPFISLLWIGILILTAGFVLALTRRLADVRAARRPALG